MKGIGLENTQQYSWVKQPNGRYTIFDIPIFSIFQDEKHGTVLQRDLLEIVKNFQHDKGENFRYPRVHIGHHEGNENRPGAGYLDNVRLNDNVVMADLVELTPDVFQDIYKKIKFPYVSAEYNPKKKKISSLALLESQPPFFQFPLLKLREQPQNLSHFQKNVKAIWECRAQILKFQEGCPCMDEEKKENGTTPLEPNKDKMVEDDSLKYKCQLEEAGLGAKIDRLLSLMEETHQKIQQIHEWEQSYHGDDEMGEQEESMPTEENPEENPEEFGSGEPSKPMQPQSNPMKKPSSVAFQNQSPELVECMKELSETVRGIAIEQNRIRSQMNFSAVDERLRAICDRQGLNFQEQSQVVRKFSTNKDREVYIGMLEKSSLQKHPASSMGYVSKAQEKESSSIMQKFQDSPDFQRQLAHRACEVYTDTVNQHDQRAATKFQVLWPDMEKFVKYVVEESYTDPHVLDKMTC